MTPILYKAGIAHRKLVPALVCVILAAGLPVGAEETGPFAEMEAPELTIVGTRETSQQMKVVTREDIEKTNAPDLAALLEETAGLSTARYGPYGSQGDINLRGFDTERVAFLIDGVPANSQASGEFDYSQLDLHSIERIEVIYGGSDSRYNVSGAIGGVINIITVKKQRPGLRVSGGFSNMSALPGAFYRPSTGEEPPQWQDLADTQNVYLSAGMGLDQGSWNLNLFANRAANHFLYWDTRFEKTRRKESNEVWDTGLSAAYIREFDNLALLMFNGSVYYGDKNIPKSGYSEQYNALRDISTRENIMLQMPRAFHDTLEMEASLSHTLLHETMLDNPDTLMHGLTAINRWAWYPAGFLTLRAGADYRYGYIEVPSVHYRHEGGLSLALEWSPHHTVTLIPSIRAAFQNADEPVNSPIFGVPKFGILWKPSPALEIRNNYFRSYKIPDMLDLYWHGGNGEWGNPDLKPEDGWGADAGLSWKRTLQSGRRITLGGSVYTQWYDNSIHWYNGKPRNVGGAFYYGADAEAAVVTPLEKGPFTAVKLSFSYQFMMSYLLAYGYTFESDRRVPYMPVHRPGVKLEADWKTGSSSLTAFFEAERVAEDYITVLDPYLFITLNASQKIGGAVSVWASLRNALNARYQSFKDYPMPGVTLTLGTRIQFDLEKQ